MLVAEVQAGPEPLLWVSLASGDSVSGHFSLVLISSLSYFHIMFQVPTDVGSFFALVLKHGMKYFA